MPKIPDRWDQYLPFNRVMVDTNFLAVKVPLSDKFVASMPDDQQFTPEVLIRQCQQLGLKLGLVVDLTFTTKYYNPMEFTSRGIAYEKIFVEGHEIPNAKCIDRFKSVVNQFRSASPDSVVAVHCTHGVNRTGYMICRYLIDVDNWPPEVAIATFGESRGFPIERENYLANLRASSPAKPQVRPLPTSVDGEAATPAVDAPVGADDRDPRRHGVDRRHDGRVRKWQPQQQQQQQHHHHRRSVHPYQQHHQQRHHHQQQLRHWSQQDGYWDWDGQYGSRGYNGYYGNGYDNYHYGGRGNHGSYKYYGGSAERRHLQQQQQPRRQHQPNHHHQQQQQQ